VPFPKPPESSLPVRHMVPAYALPVLGLSNTRSKPWFQDVEAVVAVGDVMWHLDLLLTA
jgi:hypothetical protein